MLTYKNYICKNILTANIIEHKIVLSYQNTKTPPCPEVLAMLDYALAMRKSVCVALILFLVGKLLKYH